MPGACERNTTWCQPPISLVVLRRRKVASLQCPRGLRADRPREGPLIPGLSGRHRATHPMQASQMSSAALGRH